MIGRLVSGATALLALAACGSPAGDGADAGGETAPAAETVEVAVIEPFTPATFGQPAPAGGWRAGDVVLASPASMETWWQRCVIAGPPEIDAYPAQCVDVVMSPDGAVRTVGDVMLQTRWIIPDDPSWRPDLTIETALAAEAARAAAANAPPPAPAPDGDARAVAEGDYECWANGSANLLLNFTVTGNGRYRASDNSTGRFDYDASTGAISFTGYLRDVMLDGWTTNYHEQGGVPTVSFVSDRGSEAAFCQRV